MVPLFSRWTVNSKWHAEKEVGNGNSPPPTEAPEEGGFPPEAVWLFTGSQTANAAHGFRDWWLGGKLLEERSCNNAHIRGVLQVILGVVPLIKVSVPILSIVGKWHFSK